MSGSVFFVAIVVVIGIVAAIVITPILLIPAALLVLTALFAAPALAVFLRADRDDRGSSGVPTSSEASYEPVSEPTERSG